MADGDEEQSVFEGEYTLTAEEYHAGVRLYEAQPVSWWMWLRQIRYGARRPPEALVAGAVLVAFAAIVVGYRMDDGRWLLAGIVGGVFALWLCVLRENYRRGVRTYFDELAKLKSPTTFRIDAEGLSMASTEGRSVWYWKSVTDVVSDERTLLIYLDFLATLPKSAFGTDEDFARASTFAKDCFERAKPAHSGFTRAEAAKG